MTRKLLAAGVAAGPLFAVVVVLQLVTRDGFDITHHPISLLELSDAGWVQVANFIGTGLLYLGFAVGLARSRWSGIGRRWVPRLIGLLGLALVAGGVFVPDPGLGYPPGTPDRIPVDLSWHGALHAVAPPLGFAFLAAATFVLARRFHASGEHRWAWFATLSGLLALGIPAHPDESTISWRIAVGLVVGFGFLTAFAARELAAEMRTLSSPPAAPGPCVRRRGRRSATSAPGWRAGSSRSGP